MNIHTNPFVRPFAASLATGAMVTGLLFAGAPAANATGQQWQPSPLSQILSEAAVVSAQFWAKAATVVEVKAKAKAAAMAGVDVTGKILLEEEKTRSPHAVLRNMVAPTKAEARENAIVVHSMAEGQRKLTEAVKVYDAKVNKVKVRIAKLKLKIEHADTRKERRELRAKLKKAKARLKTLKTSWKHKPIIGMAEGTCYGNSGRNNSLELMPFRDCVDGNKKMVYAGWVPELREAVIVSILFDDGTYKVSCINFMSFEVPPETPDRSLYVVVESLLKVKLKVAVEYTETVELTVGGKLTCPSGEVVEDEITKRVSKTERVVREVSAKSVEEALRIGEEQVRYDDVLKEQVRVKIRDTMTQEVGASMNLECPNQKPYIDVIQSFEHLFADGTPDNGRDDGGVGRMKVVIGDAEDSPERILANFSVANNVSTTGPVKVLVNDSNYPVHVAIEGNQVVAYFWIRALALKDPNVAENFTVTIWYVDAAGQRVSVTTDPKPVTPDEF